MIFLTKLRSKIFIFVYLIRLLFSNKKEIYERIFENDHIRGEPDLYDQDKEFLGDIKCSWNHSTFPLTDINIPNKDYYWQLQAYMGLTDLNEGRLIYCLVDTPDELIHDEIKWVRA